MLDEDLLEDGFDLIVLDQTPEDLSTVHREEALQDLFVLEVESFVVGERVDLLEVGVAVVEVLDAGIALASVNEVDEVLLQAYKFLRY